MLRGAVPGVKRKPVRGGRGCAACPGHGPAGFPCLPRIVPGMFLRTEDPMRRFTPRRPWAPLTDEEWDALAFQVLRVRGPGRPLADPRARMDAMLHVAVTGKPWRLLPEDYGRPDTASRLFRRWAHAGLWSRLLERCCAPDAPPALRGLEYWLCRAARRAMRILGMAGILLAQRLGLLTALPMVPWMMPDVDLSNSLFRLVDRVLANWWVRRPRPGLLTRIGRLLATAGGRPVWSRRFAPP